MIYMIWMIVVVLIISLLTIGVFFFKNRQQEQEVDKYEVHDLQRAMGDLQALVNGIPNRVTNAITGSVSNYKGKLGELVAYINLRGSYDRIIPLGDITDYICITFAKDGKPGKLTFLDVKNGKSARLSQDQKALKQIIREKNIEFIKLEISTEDILNDNNSGSDTQI